MPEQGYRIAPTFAERIATTVKRVEAMPFRVGTVPMPVRFEDNGAGGGGGTSIRLFSFTGPWAKGDDKQVTELDAEGAELDPTVVFIVKNHFVTLSDYCGTRKGAAAQVGEFWLLIAAECI